MVNSTGVGTLGRVAQVPSLSETAIVDSHMTIIRANPRHLRPNVLALSLFNREGEIEALGEGSTGQTELSRQRVGSMPVLIPPMAIQDRFDALVGPMRSKMELTERESSTLAALRDTLLPKLLSGEIRVKAAEKAVAAVA